MVVYSEDDNQHRAYKLQNGNYASDACGRYYQLNVQYVDYDGEKFGLCGTRLSIRAFGGTAPITKLPAFPLEYHPHEEKAKASMIKRGKLFEEYAGYHFKAYGGIALGPGFCGMIKYTVNSRIIIDTYAYNRFCPNRKVSLSRFSQSNEVSYDDDDNDDDCYDYYDDEDNFNTDDTSPKPRRKQLQAETPPLTPDQLLTATHTLRGYSLKDKKWLLFNIASVQPIVWNDRAFDSLVAPPEQKDLILTFAQTQADQAKKNRGRDSFDDVIQGKGRGIIMLLSGPPGVGKTLTAESVAEQMQVPLYTMSAGDLGTEPQGVEAALGNILEMNTKWNAVLLLDEADVFLEARGAHDLERNKLVSIFLRLLEVCLSCRICG